MENTFIGVVPLSDYTLKFYLTDGSVRIFDVKPYLDKGDFIVLKNIDIFNTVFLDHLDGVCWDYKNISLSKDTIVAHMH